mgnify:CR=1 FL=1
MIADQKGVRECTCSCHRSPGGMMKHIVPCCSGPPLFTRWEHPFPAETTWVQGEIEGLGEGPEPPPNVILGYN